MEKKEFERRTGQKLRQLEISLKDSADTAGLPARDSEKMLLKQVVESWREAMNARKNETEIRMAALQEECNCTLDNELKEAAQGFATKILFIKKVGKSAYEKAQQSSEYQIKATELRGRFEKKQQDIVASFEALATQEAETVSANIERMKKRISERADETARQLAALLQEPYLWRAVYGNGGNASYATYSDDRKIRFSLWLKQDGRAEQYLEQEHAMLLAAEPDEWGLWAPHQYDEYLSLAEAEIRKAEYNRGYQEGHDEGYDEGYDEGEKHGYEKGMKKGRKKGYEEGFEEGHRAGLEAQIDDEADEAFDELFDGDEEFDDFPDDESKNDLSGRI